MITYNLEGYKRTKYYLAKLISQYSPFLIFLQEHWLPHYEAKKKLSEDFVNFNFLTTSSDMFLHPEDLILKSTPTWHGTAIGWPKHIDMYVQTIPTISERFCGIQYDYSDINIIAYSVYLPTSGKDDEFHEIVSSLLNNIEQYLNTKSILILGMDSNQSEKSTERRKNIMAVFCEHLNLKSIMCEETNATFHHTNGSESLIDHIYYFIPTNVDIFIKLQDHLCKWNFSENISSHDAIIGSINFPTQESHYIKKIENHSYSPFISHKPKWNKINMEQYQYQCTQLLKSFPTKYSNSEQISLAVENISNGLVQYALQSSDPIKVRLPKPKKNQMPHFSTEYKNAHKLHKTVCQKWRKAGRPADPTHPIKMERTQSQ